MTLARHTFAVALAIVAGAIVFSPLIAALNGVTIASIRGVAVALPLARSTAIALVASVVALVLGVPFAIVVERAGPFVRRVGRALAIATLIVPPYLAGEAAIVLLGPAGKLSRGAAILGGLAPADALGRARFAVPGFVFSWPAAGIVLGGCLFPIVALAVGSAYRRTDQRLFESARLAQGRRGVVEVAAHALVPPALGAASIVFAIALTEFAVPQLLRVRTVGEAIYERIQEGDVASAAALGLPLMPVVVLSGAGGAWMLAKSRPASAAGNEGDVPRFGSPNRRASRDATAIVVALFATLPALGLPLTSLVWLLWTSANETPSASVHAVNGASFIDALRGAWNLARDDAIRTVVLATLAATIATSGAALLVRAVGAARWRPTLGVLGAGLAVPAPIVGLGLITLWNNAVGAPVYKSPAIVLLAWLARFLPVAVFLAQSTLARVPRELEEAAALAGRGPIRRFAGVVLPSAAVGLTAAFVATYVLCATEFGATLLVSPPGASLLAPSVVNLIRRGQDPAIAACQLLLLAVVACPLLVVVVGAARLAWRRRR